jgi:type I restriction enzyme S subunit
MIVFRIAPNRDSTYFMWQLNTPIVFAQASEDQLGTAAPHVNVEKIRNFRLLVPPLDEQRAIVAHIARETAKLDTVRAAIERTIDLLRERRTALIAAAVTGQIDPIGYSSASGG